MTHTKQHILDDLRAELQRWEDLLSSLSEEQIISRNLPSDLSIKDVIAHLWAWQQRSLARVEAAANNQSPRFPNWPEGLNPGSEEDVDAINAWIHETYLDTPWAEVHQGWRDNFTRLLERSEAVPESDMFQTRRYPWLGSHALSEVLTSTYDHHHEEHLGPLQAWLDQNQGKL